MLIIQLPKRPLASLLAACVLALAWFPDPGFAQSQPLQDLTTYPRLSLEIAHVDKSHKSATRHFNVWLADTPSRQEQGLMFVRDLPISEGMLFPMAPPQVAHFWMKNTYIELDMIFVGTDGHIAKIIERAQPLKLDTLSSDQPVNAVLELKGGAASELGLQVGDRVSWSKAS